MDLFCVESYSEYTRTSTTILGYMYEDPRRTYFNKTHVPRVNIRRCLIEELECRKDDRRGVQQHTGRRWRSGRHEQKRKRRTRSFTHVSWRCKCHETITCSIHIICHGRPGRSRPSDGSLRFQPSPKAMRGRPYHKGEVAPQYRLLHRGQSRCILDRLVGIVTKQQTITAAARQATPYPRPVG